MRKNDSQRIAFLVPWYLSAASPSGPISKARSTHLHDRLPHAVKTQVWCAVLETMSRYGLVDLCKEKRQVRPVVKAIDFRILAAA
jgi:hypothetical protein